MLLVHLLHIALELLIDGARLRLWEFKFPRLEHKLRAVDARFAHLKVKKILGNRSFDAAHRMKHLWLVHREKLLRLLLNRLLHALDFDMVEVSVDAADFVVVEKGIPQ